eukprot:m.217411 g.217411  ORF g.217411 m.217411 type:complete len:259 (+) comp54106_c0_seq28:460-1236(+)
MKKLRRKSSKCKVEWRQPTCEKTRRPRSLRANPFDQQGKSPSSSLPELSQHQVASLMRKKRRSGWRSRVLLARLSRKQNLPTPEKSRGTLCGTRIVETSSSVLETFQLPSMLLLLQVWIHRSLSVIWLSVSKKCKGAFFHSNVLSKVALDSSNGVLFSNRAACHLKLGDSHACAEDCTKALALLTPPVPANLKSRVNALTRRATALVSLGDQLSALHDFQAALRLDPSNAAVESDIATLKSRFPELEANSHLHSSSFE